MPVGRHNPTGYGTQAEAVAPQVDPMAGLNRVTALAAYRLLTGGQLPDLLTPEAMERFPVEPPNGSALKFEKSWGGSRVYTYVALRVGDQWYITGQKNEVMDWEDLKGFIHNNPCCICTVWSEVPAIEPSPFETMTPAEWHAAMWPEKATVEGSTEQS